ncbi:hypothetical protein AAW12_08860 [Sphingobacterium sp. Ag1]|uniref:hypothetical protein n=1 Tax=Sphingobacterium sp. Ag1 TaxID=1643451 RepID=UPI000627C1FF|nr:hypothetical protein [Sphingobacterium sp. Ag1]KKO91761.1 hypothetical protein AAW12_08860 [Sphingobacterium sp. Ag1]
MERDHRLAVVYAGMPIFKKSYRPVLAKDRLPANKDKKVLWFDSSAVITEEEYASYNQVKDMIGFLFDSWMELDISIANPFNLK